MLRQTRDQVLIAADLAIAAMDGIGEGPVWDVAGQRLLWVDHTRAIVHEAKPAGANRWCESRRWEPGHAVSAAIPHSGGGLIIAGGDAIVLLDAAGHSTPFERFDIDVALERLNDVKCDARGRLWAGTFATDFSPRAALYRVDPDGVVTRILESVTLSNGFDWSSDGGTFYFIDSLKCTIDAFDFDMERGTLANRRVLVTIRPADGVPNGMTVDSEGCLWVALTCGGEVRRFGPDGSLLTRVQVPVPGATSCAFGGADGTDLFITSRTGRVPEIVRTLGVREEMMESAGPHAGGLFVCRPGATGRPATPFAGARSPGDLVDSIA